ncbi:MAG: hypothetical protein UY65_C0036G0010 [Parcubacteria group bacterium GW2011_GWA2_51_12]|nr:MAG: hypothetical protein UY65_C0036G0010 [Parcubacteria group bacterium GW2011_GWA2_51_12]
MSTKGESGETSANAGLDRQKQPPEKIHRTTLAIHGSIFRNAAILCAFLDLTMNKYIEDLMAADLEKRGINPTALPDVNLPYFAKVTRSP